MVDSIDPTELKKKMERKEDFILLDVRTPDECAVAKISGSKNIPLDELPTRITEIDKKKEIVAYCHHGVRSMQACEYLSSKGFKKLKNVSGGIDEWSVKVDKKVKRY